MLARMRTIKEAIATIKTEDPDTSFTHTALRRMIKAGEIPSVSIGNKYLISLDVLYEYLHNPIPRMKDTLTGDIRPLSERIRRHNS